jgi:hypothetical protein
VEFEISSEIEKLLKIVFDARSTIHY